MEMTLDTTSGKSQPQRMENHVTQHPENTTAILTYDLRL